ncbi:MAG TPA: hypothetical protein PLB89_08895 [Flavobacteriales bacterium]|nr:hypothetical protein [Flavobacteriales bacterium]
MAVLLTAQEVHIPLNDGWQFQQVGKEQWYSAEVPGVVQTDLLRHGLIPDFMQGSNIDSVQWIENEDWVYKRTIVVSDSLLKHGHLDLVFKGLDTFAEVYINDSLIGKADNMFRTWEWPIKSLLRLGANELNVIFRSPIKEGAKLRDAYGIQLPHDNDPTGVSPYIRKAAYQFGWDFCPRLVTSGIWRSVELRGWSKARVYGVDMRRSDDPASKGKIMLMPSLEIDERIRPDVRLFLDDSLVLSGHHGSMVRSKDPAPLSATLEITASNRWHPRGRGSQSLHRLRCEVLLKNKVVSTWEESVGFARAELVQRTDTVGRSFSFMVNGQAVFAKGVNLVPPSMVPISDGPWQDLVAAMVRADMNMVRVWSGGVYPPEAFYDACDAAGILVWQDIMIANLPPGTRTFSENVGWEVADLVGQLQRHPCVALYCGNNELDVAWKNWGWQSRYGLHEEDSTMTDHHYRDLFTIGIPTALDIHGAEDVPYSSTSPLSNWGNAEGLKSGDLHYWGVWHGDSTFSSFKNNVGRFVSEYGFQSYPDSALLSQYIDPKELYLGSPAMERLQRSYKTDRPIWEAMERELGEKPTTIGGFIEGSQRAQALAYQLAIEAHMSAQPRCMGTLLWQLNDCWPGPSWSIIDYAGNPKPAYEMVKRLYTTTP